MSQVSGRMNSLSLYLAFHWVIQVKIRNLGYICTYSILFIVLFCSVKNLEFKRWEKYKVTVNFQNLH